MNRTSKKIVLRSLIPIVTLVLADQITKAFFASRDFFVLGMHFYLIKNYGLSFGLHFGQSINLIIIILVFGFFLYYARKNLDDPKTQHGNILVLAGAIANLLDRIFLGYVRDFWDIRLGFTFNLADVFILLGLLAILAWGGSEHSSNKQGNQEGLVG